MGTEWANDYFPDTVGSYWTYQDQDGNELTRYAVEPEEVDGETYRCIQLRTYHRTIGRTLSITFNRMPTGLMTNGSLFSLVYRN